MKLRGFTIVEVVVAVAIVTLLAAIVIPDLWAAQQRITGEMFMNNVHDITTTLELYKKEHSGLYPTQLEELASYFDKQPINQYTKSSMLSSDAYQSGVQYTPSADRKSYTLVVTQRDVNDLDRDKNKTETVAEALGQPFSFGNVQPTTPTVVRTYIITLRTVPNNTGQLVAFPNPAKAGQTVMLSQKPANCYNFGSWSSPDVTIINNSFVMPAKDVTVTANYTIRQYTVSAAPNNPSYGTVTGSGTYNCGSTATLTASAATNYIFVGWYENNALVTTSTTYIFTVNSNRTLEARFRSLTYTIVVTASPVGVGTQTATPNPAYVGQTVTLSATPTSCYKFSGWLSPDVTISNPLSPTASFIMPEKNATIIANYIIQKYTITATNVQYGTVTGTGTYNCGSTATLIAVPNTGYMFIGWYENGISLTASTVYIFTVSSTRTLEARFKQVEYHTIAIIETTQTDFSSGTLANVTATNNSLLLNSSTALSFNNTASVPINWKPTTVANTFTMEMWVLPQKAISIFAQTNAGVPNGVDYTKNLVISESHGGDTAAGAGISVGTNGIAVIEHGSNYYPQVLSYSTTISGWTHIAIVYNNRTPSLYINGQFIKTGLTSGRGTVYPGVRATYGGVLQGIGFGAYGYYQGMVDDVRIWNVARSATEIQADMNRELIGNESGLVGYWKLNEGAGATIYDSTSNGSNGTINGAQWVTNYTASGTRTSPIYNITTAGTVESATITWTANTPAGTSVTVETRVSLDSGATWTSWQTVASGSAVPGLPKGTNLASARIQLRQTLSTTNSATTPQLQDVTIQLVYASDFKTIDITETTQTDFSSGTLSNVTATADKLELAKDTQDTLLFYDDITSTIDSSKWTASGNVSADGTYMVIGDGTDDYDSVLSKLTFAMPTGSDKLLVEFRGQIANTWLGYTYLGLDTMAFRHRWENTSKTRAAIFSPTLTEADLDARYNDVRNYKIVITATQAQFYIDNVLKATMAHSVTQPSKFGANSYEANNFAKIDWVKITKQSLGYFSSGTRTSPIYNIATAGTVESATITWTANTPAGTSVTVETRVSLDGGATWTSWQTVASGSAVPGLPKGTNLANARIQLRQTLSTTNSAVTPQLLDITVKITSTSTGSITTNVNSIP